MPAVQGLIPDEGERGEGAGKKKKKKKRKKKKEKKKKNNKKEVPIFLTAPK